MLCLGFECVETETLVALADQPHTLVRFSVFREIRFRVMFNHHSRILVNQTGAETDLEQITVGPPLVWGVQEKAVGTKSLPSQQAEGREHILVHDPVSAGYIAEPEVLMDQTKTLRVRLDEQNFPRATTQRLDSNGSRSGKGIDETGIEYRWPEYVE